ncbi:MAG TPA: formate dehydrogenase accessory sulfurtransferase FdhD [Myxococcota bacterium]
MSDPGLELWPARVVVAGAAHELPDPVVVEEPLEIQVDGRPLVVTMRTPGHDAELAAGWLFAEGLIESREDLLALEADAGAPGPNVAGVRLRDARAADAARARAFLSASACGVCGKSAIEQVFARGLPALPAGRPRIARARLEALPAGMRAAQPLFARTGGLHAAALFTAGGALVVLREDVGRHNAVDKVVGERLLAGALPQLADCVLLLSGRAGFEIVQKAARAGIPVVAAVGAPSSLALRVAERCGMTLVGFLRADRFNVYTGMDRLEL